MPVGPTVIVVPDGTCKNFGNLVEIFGDKRVEMNLWPGVLYRCAKPEKYVKLGFLASPLQKIVGRLENVIGRILRIAVDKREYVVIIAHMLIRVDERPIMSSRILKAHRPYLIDRCLGATLDFRSKTRAMKLWANLPDVGRKIHSKRYRKNSYRQKHNQTSLIFILIISENNTIAQDASGNILNMPQNRLSRFFDRPFCARTPPSRRRCDYFTKFPTQFTILMQNGNFAAADCGLVVLAAAATRLYGDHIFSLRQIGIERKFHPCTITMKYLRLHYALISAFRAAFNPYAFIRIRRIVKS
jgi:hypothetical protein